MQITQFVFIMVFTHIIYYMNVAFFDYLDYLMESDLKYPGSNPTQVKIVKMFIAEKKLQPAHNY